MSDVQRSHLSGTKTGRVRVYDFGVSDGHESSLWRRAVIVPIAAAQLGLAAIAASAPVLALGLVGAAVVAGLALLAPLVLLISAFPATFAYWRVGPASIGMSVADALTFAGAFAALPFVPWRSPTLRRVLAATAGYCGILFVTVLAHPSQRALVEVGHRASMVVGAMLIGAAVARLGRVRLALRAFIACAALVSVAAALDTLAHHLEPAYPFGIQKNAAGELIVMALVIMLTVPRRVALGRIQTAVVAATLVFGLAASEARGPALALIAVFALHLVRQRRRGGSSRIMRMAPLLLVVSVLFLGISVVTYKDRDLNQQTQQFNSLNSRLDTYHYAIQNVWEPHLFDGSGLKWFFAPNSPVGAPHNMVISELSEAGLVGLLGLIILLYVILRCMSRSSSELGEAAFLIVIGRVLESMLGIFWTAGTGTLPFLIVGLVIGDEEEAIAERPSRVAAFSR
jgi:O-antigen ligase